MKYCQGPKCHEYKTKDRIRGHKGDKHYETRKRSGFYYLNGNRAIDHFGRIHEAKRTDASGAWYKDYLWDRSHTGDGSRYNHFFINDLLGERRPITEQQYNDTNLITPS